MALEVLCILALAQHHGLPTRLLDWTWDWRVAAFFAARDNYEHHEKERGGAKKKGERPDLVVWSLDARDLQAQERFQRYKQTLGTEHALPTHMLKIVTAPSATNSNLQAQKGLFTLLSVHGIEPDPPTPLEILPQDLAGHPPEFVKFVLPGRLSGQLLYVVALEGVTSATVEPGYAGVVRSLKERDRWEGLSRSLLKFEM